MSEQQAGRNAKQARAGQAATESRFRKKQLEDTQAAVAKLEIALRSARDKDERCEALTSHLLGFYEEVDKLTKGKALLEATDLIVEHANDVVRDAKTLIEGDPHLDRIKEFVPAGNNPVYPDVFRFSVKWRRGVSVSVNSALRAGIFKASGSFDPMMGERSARSWFPRLRSSSR